MRFAQITTTAVTALLLASCAQYATVSERRPRFTPTHTTIGSLKPVEQSIAKAMLEERHHPLAAMGELLKAAEKAEQQLERNPKDAAARDAYNFAVARVFGVIRYAKLDPWSKPLHVPADGGEFVLTHQPDPRPQWNPALYNFTPADQFDVGGTYVTRHVQKEGVGAPLVAVGREDNANAGKDFTTPRLFYGVTGLIRFEGRRAVIGFADPLATETVRLDGHTFPLAADYTVPVAVMLATMNPKKLELTRLLRPEKYAETARIARLQPYDPNKTVVLVVHGLMDSPATWAPMINHLRADENIRRNFQFWFYSYPSGYPYPYSASILRHELDAIEKRFPMRKKMVLVGHSMGGCISRLMITDSGDKLWMQIFKKPPGEVTMSPESRKLLTEGLFFRHRPEVGRVIFISAPLKGSQMASGWAGRIGSMLVRSPRTLLRVGGDVMRATTFQADELKLKRIPNSVDTLAPNNRFVRVINTIPLTPGIPYHVICGDRGKGGNKDHTKPEMSDGIVPYWSSHMEGAQSELIVPSSHSAHQNMQAIDEVQRILNQHAGR
jgi:pimeloyl-ACP methyl ester carboxylesterase